MAAKAPLQDFLGELTCSICLDFFQDPVLIPECGHNFCRGCLTRIWETSESEASCPQCRQAFAPRSLLPNRQLVRLVEEARRCDGPRDEEGGSFCPKHREPLKLFCKDHETLICLVCDRSNEHKGHSVIPMEEAFQEYQIKVGDCLKAQKKQKKKIATSKRDTEQTMQERLDIIKKVKKYVVAEFRELQLLLEEQEKLLLSEMEEAEKDIMDRKEKRLAKHTEELCSLDNLIQEIEEKHQQPANKLLQDIGSMLKKYVNPPSSLQSQKSSDFLSCVLSVTRRLLNETIVNLVDLLGKSKWTIWDYMDITVFLKSAMKKLRENVTLDPDTAHPDRLEISEDRKSAKGLSPVKEINAVGNCKRFEYDPYVLGCQEFSTGRHFWEVIVGDKAGWGVGVANKPLNLTDVDLETRHWQIGQWEGKYLAISPTGCSELVLTDKPTRIRICLSCEEGQVAFFDARTAALLHTFSDASLVGETLLPSFYLNDGASLTLPSKKGHP